MKYSRQEPSQNDNYRKSQILRNKAFESYLSMEIPYKSNALNDFAELRAVLPPNANGTQEIISRIDTTFSTEVIASCALAEYLVSTGRVTAKVSHTQQLTLVK